MTSYQLDHLVLTVQDIERTCQFYQTVLNIPAITFSVNRTALKLDQQKINLHQADALLQPHAQHPTPGSADLCLISDTPIAILAEQVRERGVSIIEGPVRKTGATGSLLSIYIRDPDGNLIELSNRLPG